MLKGLRNRYVIATNLGVALTPRSHKIIRSLIKCSYLGQHQTKPSAGLVLPNGLVEREQYQVHF